MKKESTANLFSYLDEKKLAICVDELARKNKVCKEAVIVLAWTNLMSKYVLDDVISVNYFNDIEKEKCCQLSFEDLDDKKISELLLTAHEIITDESVYKKVKISEATDSRQKGYLVCKLHNSYEPELEELPVKLSLLIDIDEDRIGYEIIYDDKYYDSSFVNDLILHIYSFLMSWNKDDNEIITKIEYLSNLEKERIYEESIGISSIISYQKDIYEYFIEQVKISEDKTALIDYQKNINYTYNEVDKRIRILSEELKKVGINSESVVGVYLERSVDVVICLLSILKLGAIYVPLDRSYPEEYLNSIIDDCNLDVIITEEEVKIRNVSILNLKNIDFYTYLYEEENKYISSDTSETSFVFYTSGSTGKPKGVMQTQKQLINRLHWMWKEYPFEAEEVMGQRAALNTIPSLWDLLGGLLAGIPTVVVPDAVIQDSEKLINCLYEKKISFITLTPSILRLISLNEGENSDKTRYLRVVLTLGEKFTQKIYEDVRKTLKKTIIVNDYGSTETHTNLYGKYDENVKDITKEGLKQITNVNAFILDSNDGVTNKG